MAVSWSEIERQLAPDLADHWARAQHLLVLLAVKLD
jgi:hypothetical protein